MPQRAHTIRPERLRSARTAQLPQFGQAIVAAFALGSPAMLTDPPPGRQPPRPEHAYASLARSVPAVLPPGVPLPLRPDPVPRRPAAAAGTAATGFPSPADDYVEARIDLNVELIPSPLSTFFMRVRGDAMRGDGILDGDLVVIDRSIDPRPGMVVVATWEGSFLLRRLRRHRGGGLRLVASDGLSPPLRVREEEEGEGPAELWGVVIHAVHHLAGAPSRRH